MKRREFIKSTILGTVTAGAFSIATQGNAQTSPQTGREFYELRHYRLRRGPMQKLFDDYCREALIPALNRLDIKPIGVFNVMLGPDSPAACVLIPFKDINQYVNVQLHIFEDKEYQKAGAEFINAPPTSPAYVRFESSLMIAFEGMPKLEVPSQVKEKKSRIYELRIYESHSEKAHLKKVEMFNCPF